MSNYDNNMRGVLFKNKYKEKPNQPDATGEITINNTTYRLSGWNKTSKNGERYVSVSVSEQNFGSKDNETPAGIDDEIMF